MKDLNISSGFVSLYTAIWSDMMKQKNVYLHGMEISAKKWSRFSEFLVHHDINFRIIFGKRFVNSVDQDVYSITVFSDLPFEYKCDTKVRQDMTTLKNEFVILWNRVYSRVDGMLDSGFSSDNVRRIKIHHGDRGKKIKVKFLYSIEGVIVYEYEEAIYFYYEKEKEIKTKAEFSKITMFDGEEGDIRNKFVETEYYLQKFLCKSLVVD